MIVIQVFTLLHERDADIVAVNDAAAVIRLDVHQTTQQSRFPAAVFRNDGYFLPEIDPEGKVFEQDTVTIRFGEVFNR